MPSDAATNIIKLALDLITLKYPYAPPPHVAGSPPPPPVDPFAFPLQLYPLFFFIIRIYVTRLPAKTRALGLILACLFAPIEYMFYMMTVEDPTTGSVEPNWGALMGTEGNVLRKGHTTVYQFVANVVFAGPIFMAYYQMFSRVPGLRGLLIPFTVWALEVVEGHFLMLCYSYNPAWLYTGSDAYLNGTIKLSYWRYWLPLGIILDLGGWKVLMWAADRLAPRIATRKELMEEKAEKIMKEAKAERKKA
ncbi:hypothetical protein HDU67_008027 [Dinochytrium kinnereticum]|nr:hypothetical protein HDU67_008027 [Dinochytrium kinnereticum]